MRIEIVAKPRTPYMSTRGKELRYEQVDLIDKVDNYPEGYCIGVIHIDTFYTGLRSVYDRLLKGESVNLSLVENKETT